MASPHRVLPALLSLGLAAAAAAEGPPWPEAPWGPETDGLSCRVTLRNEYRIGEPITGKLEFRNASKERRYVVDVYDWQCEGRATATLTGPDGKPVKNSGSYRCSVMPKSFRALEPGEVRELILPDLRAQFYPQDALQRPGRYTFSYTYRGTQAPPEMVVGMQESNGQKTPLKERLPDEVVKGSFGGQLSANPSAFALGPLQKGELAVHEWGVFTVYNDLKYANAGRKAEWGELPEVFYRQFPTRRLLWAPAAWDKPIIYFHSTRECLKLDVDVTFADGAPVVWWPCCAAPVDSGGRAPAAQPGAVFRSLKWKLWLGETLPPDRLGSRGADFGKHPPVVPALFDLPQKCWLTQARNVKDARLVTASGSRLARGAPWNSGQDETEKFVYYDGLVPAPDFLRCTTVTAEEITLKNAAPFPLKDFFVVDRRRAGDGRSGFAHLTELAPGAEQKIALPGVAAADWPGKGRAELLAVLEKAGLCKDEAAALADIWRVGFFERPGVTAFYLLPQSEYDRMLKLTISPSPTELVRVGVALYPQLEGEPELSRQVQALIAKLNAPDFDAREAATKALGEMGPVAFRYLRLAEQNAENPEFVARARKILNEFDASAFLEKAARGSGLGPGTRGERPRDKPGR